MKVETVLVDGHNSRINSPGEHSRYGHMCNDLNFDVTVTNFSTIIIRLELNYNTETECNNSISKSPNRNIEILNV